MKKNILRQIAMVSKWVLYGVFAQTIFTGMLSAFDGQAQEVKSVRDSYINIEFDNNSLADAFKKIENATGYHFAYERTDLNKKIRLNKTYSGKTAVSQVLLDISEVANLKFKQINNSIIVTEKKNRHSTGDPLEVVIDGVTVTGKVTSQEDGSALPGVNVIIKGTSVGTVTDVDGMYKLDVPTKESILVFSSVGYLKDEVTVGDQTVIDRVMAPDIKSLNEIVVIGYGTEKKSDLTGAVDVISNAQIESRQSPTVSQLLQGQSPGLSFSVGNYGFQPGATMNVDIRGMGSLNGGSPYVLIDGIPGDMNNLNPEDIQSISVLKDAAASAIYGARAPYGVILITTKSGKKDEKIGVTYSGSVSIATPQNLPQMLSSVEHARVLNEAGDNRGGRSFTNDIMDRMYAYIDGDIDYLKQFTVPDAIYYETMPRSNGTWGFNNYGNANYDWFGEYYGSGLNQKHNLSLQGGGKTASYYFSAGYFGQDGVLNYGTDTYGRVNVLGKVDVAINDWWDISYQTRFMKSNRVQPNMDKQGSYDLIFHQIARTMPMNAKYDGYGNIMIQSKIPWVNDAGTDNIENTENWQTFATELRPLKGWKINADFAYQSVDQFRSDQELTVYDHLVDKSLIPSGNTVPNNIQEYHASNYYWTSNIYSSYHFSLADHHNFDVLVGTQFEYSNVRLLNAIKNNLIVQNVLSLQTATGEPSATETLTNWSTQGYFGRFTYNFKEKYLLEANIRRDGTSRFREGNQWGVFPSLAVGWNVHQEPFWAPIEKYVNTLKFRGSWGQLGNQNVQPYQDLELIPLVSNPLNWIFGYGQTRPIGYTGTPDLVSPDLSWETATTRNLGVDMTFLKDKLQANFDLFERNTTNMIGPAQAQPGVLGAPLPQENNATLRTRGWELSLKWNQTTQNDLSYFVNVNLYDSKAVVTKYVNPTGTLASSTWYEGKEQGEIWGYTANDLYRTQEELDDYKDKVDLSYLWGGEWRTGDVKYEDTNGDGAVNNGSNTIDDHGDLSIIGNSTPHYQFGISAGINFKNFDFSMLWQGTAKRDLFFDGNQNIFWGFRTWNQSSLFPEHLDYFRDQPGDKYVGLYEGDANINLDSYWPRPYINNGENNKNRVTSTRYLQNGAYVRLQNVQLGYNFPGNVLSKLHLQKLRVYVSGENLLTITKLPVGIDPVAVSSSWGVGKTYGADRIMSAGLTVTY